MKHAPLIARLVLGFIFFASGLAGLLNLAPPPADLPENMKTFMSGMMATTYFFPFLKATETICGALLMSGFFVPLALVVLAPIILNIFGVHAFMMPPSQLALPVVLGLLEIYLAFFSPYKQNILPLFKKK